MKLAIVGSRGIEHVDLDKYVDQDVDEIVSGGAIGVDACAAQYAKSRSLKLTEFLPQYERYGRGAPIVRNKAIVDYADKVLVFWNGSSKGTQSVIKYAQRSGKDCEVVLIESNK